MSKRHKELMQEAVELAAMTPDDVPFLALGVVKIGAHWHLVEVDCEIAGGATAAEVRCVGSRLGLANVRSSAIAEFKRTAVRKKVTA